MSPPKKKAKTAPSSPPPPLPASFHDLYAGTVRTAPCDDPSLHQGRTRQIPHIPGNWPTHVYVEWHPPREVHELLSGLVKKLREKARGIPSSSGTGGKGNDQGVEVTTLLESELSTPLPLHISLSRPIVLKEWEREQFLKELKEEIEKGASAALKCSSTTSDSKVNGNDGAAFKLRCTRVEWHRTYESGRSFLVLRVESLRVGSGSSSEDNGGVLESERPGVNRESTVERKVNHNPQLTELLRRCNSVAERFNQPQLYKWTEENGGNNGSWEVGEAFHLSIAWTFAEPTDELVRVTKDVFEAPEAKENIRRVIVPVDRVKVKIGNVVNNVALRQPGLKADGKKDGKNIFGI